MELAPLQGFTVGVTADRRAQEQEELLVRRGAVVLRGPTIGTSYLGDEEALRAATLALIADPPELFVANTGIGMRSWFEAAQVWGLDRPLFEALREATIIARGPKAAGAAQRAGLVVADQAPGERLSEVLALLRDIGVAGRTVAVQLHGAPQMSFIAELEAAGAAVSAVPVYRWGLPGDLAPALRLIEATCDGRLDALTFTSAPAVANLFAIAEDAGCADDVLHATNRAVVVACVGPVCADTARDLGIREPVAPEVGRLGNLVRVLVEALQSRRKVLQVGGHELVLQGGTVAVDGRTVTLSPRERAVFDALAERPGAVVSKAELESRVWGETSRRGAHRLHVSVGRLRQRLGAAGEAIEPVYGRGYRLSITAE